jgi:hypothetical protein
VALAVPAGAVVSHQILYKLIVVPRLPAYHVVPLPVWLGVMSPLLVGAVLGGMALYPWREVVLTAFLGAVAVLGYETWASFAMEPGFQQQGLIDTEPLVFGSLYVLVTMAALMTLLAAGRALKNLGGWWGTSEPRSLAQR